MNVNERIRKEVKKALVESGKSQKDVAEAIGVSAQYLSQMLNTDKSGIPKRWQDLLSTLGLKLTVVADNEK